MKILVVILTAVLAMGTVLAGCSSAETPTPSPSGSALEEGPAVGKLAPDFTLQNTNGETVTLSALRGGPVMVNFWATWCVPCGEEMPYMQQMYDTYSPKGLVFLSIDLAESADKVLSYLTERSLTFRVLLDSKQEVAVDKYGVQGVPTTILVDKNGVIQKIQVGSFISREQLETWLLAAFPELG